MLFYYSLRIYKGGFPTAEAAAEYYDVASILALGKDAKVNRQYTKAEVDDILTRYEDLSIVFDHLK